MTLSTLGRLAIKHAQNSIAETIYLKAGKDLTKPVSFYGFVNERCNIKCRYCEFWRLAHYREEMSIPQWHSALLSIRDFVGEYSISFSGGEPFLKKDFISLLEFCRDNKIRSGVTTNGLALTARNSERVVLAKPFNVNISCDSADPQLNDYLRGYQGIFDRISDAILSMRKYQTHHGVTFPILIKPTVSALNFRSLPELVRWAEGIGVTAVNMQPVDRWSPETFQQLWIEEEELPDLELVIRELIAMKRNGAPIMNTEQSINLMIDHFLERKAPPNKLPCKVGMRDFFIRPDGQVEVCWSYPSIGNINQESARNIWYGEKATKIRKETVACEKLCLQTCMSQKSLTDKVRMGIKILH